MDAVQFFMEYMRLCNTNSASKEWMCNTNCPMWKNCASAHHILIDDEESIVNMVDAVKKWSEEHKPKTNGDFVNEMTGGRFHDFPSPHKEMRQVWVDAEWWKSEHREE